MSVSNELDLLNTQVLESLCLRSSSGETVGPIVNTFGNSMTHSTIPVEVHDGAHCKELSLVQKRNGGSIPGRLIGSSCLTLGQLMKRQPDS
jgi:hypothetical protein